MDLTDVTKRAFEDELAKIAAGWTRSGRTPFTMKTLAGKAGRFSKPKRATMVKTSTVPRFTTKQLLTAAGTGAVTGIYGHHQAKKAVRDYQVGREIRRQQEESAAI